MMIIKKKSITNKYTSIVGFLVYKKFNRARGFIHIFTLAT